MTEFVGYELMKYLIKSCHPGDVRKIGTYQKLEGRLELCQNVGWVVNKVLVEVYNLEGGNC